MGYYCDDVTSMLDRLKLDELTNFDENYFPKEEKVQLIIPEYKYAGSLKPPSWLGFQRNNKSYELQTVDVIKEQDIVFDFSLCGLRVTRVRKIFNPYLERAFELKQLQKQNSGGRCLTETMYHSTLPKNVDSICCNNFNWRLFGTSRGCKHGKGVSLSPSLKFASQFCKSYLDKVIFIVEVLYENIHLSMSNVTLPMFGYDTTCSKNGNVRVKFEDSEYLPLYVVYYV